MPSKPPVPDDQNFLSQFEKQSDVARALFDAAMRRPAVGIDERLFERLSKIGQDARRRLKPHLRKPAIPSSRCIAPDGESDVRNILSSLPEDTARAIRNVVLVELEKSSGVYDASISNEDSCREYVVHQTAVFLDFLLRNQLLFSVESDLPRKSKTVGISKVKNAVLQQYVTNGKNKELWEQTIDIVLELRILT